jgi:phosphoenolpyruvate-protein phosphotransferase (PTS system enzyme I)
VEIKRGTPVSPGIAIGPAFLMETEGARIVRKFVMPEEVEQEIERFEKALKLSRDEIDALGDSLKDKTDDFYDIRDIFQIHLRMLEDPKLYDQVCNLIRNKLFTPEYAVSQVLRRYVKSLEGAGDAYLMQRIRDFDDIEQRLLRNLLGERHEDLAHLKEPVLVVARDLTPSQTVAFDRERVMAMATEAGGRTSHTAILARALRIPAAVGVGELTTAVSGGDTIIVDGTRGVVIVDPDELTLQRYRARSRSLEVIEEKIAAEFCNLPAITRDGRRVSVEANIEFPQEVDSVLQHGAEGVGLYRTEFLYHAMEDPPDEEDHFQAYMTAMRALGDHPMTIRVLDLGADKFNMGYDERNPFLGCRSMRLMRDNPEMFRKQIKAILRASAMGNIRFMFPLICSREELVEAKGLVTDVMSEMDKHGIAYDKDVKVGMMIEVPSAAIVADLFAQEVDFFSIGTNDLVQYTLAVDRDNEHVAHLFSPIDPAVLRLIQTTVDAANSHEIDVTVCGEMAGDILYSILLVGMGVTRLSMSPTAIADVKKLVCSVSYEEARNVAEKALQMNSAVEIERYLREVTRKAIPELLEEDSPLESL